MTVKEIAELLLKMETENDRKLALELIRGFEVEKVVPLVPYVPYIPWPQPYIPPYITWTSATTDTKFPYVVIY
jgi:hypothetical protein